jgi:predicted dehydrogenase
MTDKTPAFAIVGLSGFAQTHLGYMRHVVEAGAGRHVAQVVIEADRQRCPEDLEKLQAEGVEIYPSLRQMLARARDRIDVVGIPTGIPLHRSMCQAVLEAGCHVVLEKPVAGSVQDVDALLAAQQRAGKLVAVGFQDIYRRDVQSLKEWICQGRFGAVRQVWAGACWPRPPAYYQRNGWAGRLAVGDTWVLDSPHHNALAHAVNLMCFLGSAVPGKTLTPLAVTAELYRANPIEAADSVAFRLESVEGAEVFFAMAHCSDRQFDPVFRVRTDKALIELPYRGGLRIVWNDGREEKPPISGTVGVFEDMAQTLSDPDRELLCPLQLARVQTVVTCGTYESSPIRQLPAKMLETRDEDGLVFAPDMGDAVERAITQRALWSELGEEWARPGQRFSLEGYDYFPLVGGEADRGL